MRQINRQTDHARERCVRIGGIACAATKFSRSTVYVLEATWFSRHIRRLMADWNGRYLAE